MPAAGAGLNVVGVGACDNVGACDCDEVSVGRACGGLGTILAGPLVAGWFSGEVVDAIGCGVHLVSGCGVDKGGAENLPFKSSAKCQRHWGLPGLLDVRCPRRISP